MPYEIYKILHLVGLVLVFSGLVGLMTIKMSGGQLEGKSKSFVFITHGVGILLMLVSGFGLLAKLGLARDMPNWIYFKILIWLFFGGAIALVKRKGQLGWPIYIALIAIFILAAYFGVYKSL
jgi:hypothetical protein